MTDLRVSHVPLEVLEEVDSALAVTQVPLEVLYGPPVDLRVTQVVIEFLRTLSEEVFEPGQSFGPLLWAEIAGPDSTTRAYAQVPLADPASYYRGWKPAQLLRAQRITRALSDEFGQYEGQRWSITLDDTDRQWRRWLGVTATRQLLNRLVVGRMISYEAWRRKERPRTVAVGLIRNYRLE